MNAKIIHVNLKPPFCNHVSKDMIFKCLKHGGCIVKTEEHNHGFEESEGCDESHFPLVRFLNSNVIISPSDIELSKPGGIFHVINQFRDKWKRVHVSDSVRVEVLTVLAGVKQTIFLKDEEEWDGLRRFQGKDSASFKVFINEELTSFLFIGI